MNESPSIGDLVGNRYEIQEYIDEGGMQYVYKAQDRTLERTVALKTPKINSASKRFQRSARTAAKVNHPNVAKTLDYFTENDKQFLIEEFIDGLNLSKCLFKHFNLADPFLSAYILHHLAKGVRASHHAGVIHRDLKPSNIMVEGSYGFREIKVTDFGIAKMAQEEIDEAVEGGDETITGSQTVLGALPYMAPETIDKESPHKVDQAADIWSVGALLFELMTGTKPFGTGLNAAHKILSNNRAPFPETIFENKQFEFLNHQIAKIVEICLKPDPTERPTADQLVEECETLCYPEILREVSTVRRRDYRYGFIHNPSFGQDIFFHKASVYGTSWSNIHVGDRVWFSRFLADPGERAHPVLKMRSDDQT